MGCKRSGVQFPAPRPYFIASEHLHSSHNPLVLSPEGCGFFSGWVQLAIAQFFSHLIPYSLIAGLLMPANPKILLVDTRIAELRRVLDDDPAHPAYRER
jgi:hypothetical protein